MRAPLHEDTQNKKISRSLSIMETSGIYINLKLYVLSGLPTSWRHTPVS